MCVGIDNDATALRLGGTTDNEMVAVHHRHWPVEDQLRPGAGARLQFFGIEKSNLHGGFGGEDIDLPFRIVLQRVLRLCQQVESRAQQVEGASQPGFVSTSPLCTCAVFKPVRLAATRLPGDATVT